MEPEQRWLTSSYALLGAGTITLSPQTWTAPSGTIIFTNRKVMIEGGAVPLLPGTHLPIRLPARRCEVAHEEVALLHLFQLTEVGTAMWLDAHVRCCERKPR